MANKVNVGLLGAGYIFDSHAKALQTLPDVTLRAVCDVSRSRAQRAGERYGIAKVFGSVEELANSDCHVVHVLLPPAHHLEAATRLVQGGKHVFLEKPMGLDSSECDALCELADKANVAIGINHNFLFSRSYEALRTRIRSGELGKLDHVAVDWHYALPLLKFGPFDSWMLAAPSNIVFELGSHMFAFARDLLGRAQLTTALADNPLFLPAQQKVYRHWFARARAGAASAVFSLSVTAGQEDRMLRVRGRGGSAELDFGRDFGWVNETTTDNPIFDSYAVARAVSDATRKSSKADVIRRMKSALRKRPDANPFEESVVRSIRAFYSNGFGNVDERHQGRFGLDVIRLCEETVRLAETGSPSRTAAEVTRTQSHLAPTVLVVGGTGFIGRKLVRKLLDKGVGVRILTRSTRAASIEFEGLPVDLVGGTHGDPDCARRALDGISTVYHLAKCEGKNWHDYVVGDIEPTRVLAEAAIAAGVTRFIYTGTIASYDCSNPRARIDNTTPVDPAISHRSHYARSKAACERLLQDLQQSKGLPLVILRPGIVVGPGSPPAHLGIGRFASETRVDFWGDGLNRLPLVLVDDVVEALVLSLDRLNISGETLLLVSPPLLNAREYVSSVAKAMGSKIKAQPHSALRYYLADLLKELAKNAIRHPNRRWPSLHDWQCQSHSAVYDASMTEQALGWKPVSVKDEMIKRGIVEPVEWFTR